MWDKVKGRETKLYRDQAKVLSVLVYHGLLEVICDVLKLSYTRVSCGRITSEEGMEGGKVSFDFDRCINRLVSTLVSFAHARQM